jgi:23S rRNA U2552 (ribose-2'-O)-methylase RlmE/FtsJ
MIINLYYPSHQVVAEMAYFELPKATLSIADFDENAVFDNKSDVICDIYRLKEILNATKSELDEIYKLPCATKVMLEFNPFVREKYNIAKSLNTYNITVAWLKGYELMHKFNLLKFNKHSIVHFDNAAFPGSFILAAHHLAKTNGISKFDWVAASLIEEIDIHTNNEKLVNTPLEDTFCLFKTHPDKWLMHPKNNGDISSVENVMDFQNTIHKKFNIGKSDRKIDFYSCDLGIGITNGQYNDQEKIHCHLNVCQIICGLLTLNTGGNMMVKHYTIFEPYTLSYISLLTTLFDKVYITKPMASKRTNSEIYIVCKNYLYPFQDNSVESYIYYTFVNQLNSNSKDASKHPLISSKYIKQQLCAINHAAHEIYTDQIVALKNYIYMTQNYTNIQIRKKCYSNLHEENMQIRARFAKIPIKPIQSCDRLVMHRAYQ